MRAHLASIGHPLAVDPAYGGAQRLRLAELDAQGSGDDILLARPPLHAAALRLDRPTTKQPLEVSAPLPLDLARVLATLRGAPAPR